MERFYSKTEKQSNGCIHWTGCIRGKSGYGAFKLNGKTVNAHRIAYILANGEITDNLLVCHKCDNRLCVNPDHLFLGTHQVNYDDGVKKGRIFKGSPLKEIKHGTEHAYKKRGCRCEICVFTMRENWKNSARKYRLLTAT